MGAYIWSGNLTEVFSVTSMGAYIWRGNLTEEVFSVMSMGAYIWKVLYVEGLIFGILR